MTRAGRLVIVLAVASSTVAASAAGRRAATAAGLMDQAYQEAYNLDLDGAVGAARQAVAEDENSSEAHRTLASVLWLDILFHRGSVTIDFYLGGIASAADKLPKPPADLDREFHEEVNRAIELAEESLARNKKDPQALYDAGAAYGLQATYIGAVDGKLLSAFHAARRAYDAHETVLERDPSRTEANLIVGTYRFLVSDLSLPTRLFAYLAGFSGGRDRGVSMVELASRSGRVQTDAKFALLLLYTKEMRYKDALGEIQQLEQSFPRNRLLVLEEGSMDIRADRASDADAVLSRGIDEIDREARPLAPGERALWFYKRGVARVILRRPADASADLAAALAAAPQGWVRGRIGVEQGKIDDLAGRRAIAVDEYRRAKTLCEQNGDDSCAMAAGRLISRPFALK